MTAPTLIDVLKAIQDATQNMGAQQRTSFLDQVVAHCETEIEEIELAEQEYDDADQDIDTSVTAYPDEDFP